MTIKSIKEQYNGRYGHGERTMYAVYDFGGKIGKTVIIVTKCASYGDTVWQAVRVSDGKELIPDGACRPCDNLDDAIDVASEMINREEN